MRPGDRLQRLYQMRSLRMLETTKKLGVTLRYCIPAGGFLCAKNAEGESSPGFSIDWTVKSARRSGLKKRRPTPPSGSSDCSLKVDAGISTLVPVLGITNLCHSSPRAGEIKVVRQRKRTAEKRDNCIGASPIECLRLAVVPERLPFFPVA
jgi:hypothetical protein